MTNTQKEWFDYLTRTIKTHPELTIQIASKHKLYREVGKYYGLSEKEMDEVENVEYFNHK